MKMIINNRYELIKNLSCGSSVSETFLAKDLKNCSRECILKVYDIKDNPHVKKILCRTRHLLCSFKSSQCTPTFYDSNPIYELNSIPEEGRMYLDLSYIEGISLEQELQTRGLINEAEATYLLQEILSIVRYVHEKNYIHNDLKPANFIRETLSNKLFIIDVENIQPIGTISQEIIGTPGYFPMDKMNNPVEPSHDIFGIGMMIIEAMTGISAQCLTRNSTGEIIFPKYSINNQPITISPKLKAILITMTHEKKESRYQSCDDVLKDFSQTEVFPYGNPPNEIREPEIDEDNIYQKLDDVDEELEEQNIPHRFEGFKFNGIIMGVFLLILTALLFASIGFIFVKILIDPDTSSNENENKENIKVETPKKPILNSELEEKVTEEEVTPLFKSGK